MKIQELDEVLVKQKEYFNSGITLDVNFPWGHLQF